MDWAKDLGLTVVNFTPGTRSNADYTGEADKNFVSSKAIFDSIVAKEQQDPNGLNGFILLLHIGSGPGRADKFHARFGELLDYLAGKGYHSCAWMSCWRPIGRTRERFSFALAPPAANLCRSCPVV